MKRTTLPPALMCCLMQVYACHYISFISAQCHTSEACVGFLMHVIKTLVSKAYCEMQLTGTSDDPLSFVSPQDLLHSHVAEAGAGDATILRSASSSQLQQVHERLQGASPGLYTTRTQGCLRQLRWG